MARLLSIEDAPNLAGKRVLLRLDLNVPIGEAGEIVDDFRIRRALPTIRLLSEAGARVFVISHIEGGGKTLAPVAAYLEEALPTCSFSKELFGPEADEARQKAADGSVILYENIRRYPEEEANDAAFAERLAGIADIYVNDAFGVCHRVHASVARVPVHLPSFAGPALLEEIENLSSVFEPLHPFLFVLGGAKFETKLPLLEKFLPVADTTFVGGALANDLLEEKGYAVGTSVTTEEAFDQKALLSHQSLLLPIDVVVEVGEGSGAVRSLGSIGAAEKIVDAGPATIESLKEMVRAAKCVLWNGPLGFYEGGYTAATEALARSIAESEAQSIVGGGDTLAAIKKLGIEDKFFFVSAGGGAMLDFLAHGSLPGIEALAKSTKG